MLYSGKQLDTLISNTTPYCAESIIEEALDLIMNKESKCIRTRTCEKTRFKSTNKVHNRRDNKALVYLTFENPEVIFYHTYINYD